MRFVKEGFIRAAVVLVVAMFATAAFADVGVRGYQRDDGVYVNPHHRTHPDGNPYNNYNPPRPFTNDRNPPPFNPNWGHQDYWK